MQRGIWRARHPSGIQQLYSSSSAAELGALENKTAAGIISEGSCPLTIAMGWVTVEACERL
jgi:hypothetical protein